MLKTKCNDVSELVNENGPLSYYFTERSKLYQYRGLVDSLSIQLPEIFNKELFELIPLFKNHSVIRESFIDSLIWRKNETVTNSLTPYIDDILLSDFDLSDRFWNKVIILSTNPKSFLNANWLHNRLIKLSLVERDAMWTSFINRNYFDNDPIDRLIKWCRDEEDLSHIFDESLLLASITLSWFLTSTNRRLRDNSTKSLVIIFKSNFNLVEKVLIKFEGVNDPYVYERLFSAAYGASLWSCSPNTDINYDLLAFLSHYIHRAIFKNKKEIYPHVLLRDYARNIIEYAHYLKIPLEFEMKDVRPPYQSI